MVPRNSDKLDDSDGDDRSNNNHDGCDDLSVSCPMIMMCYARGTDTRHNRR